MDTLKIGDPIQMLASFGQGNVRPRRFRWQNRLYTVTGVNGEWVDRREEIETRHFSLQVDEETFFVHFSTRDMQWWLDELIVC